MKKLLIQFTICIILVTWLLTRLDQKVNDIELVFFLGISIYFMVIIVKMVIWYIQKNVNIKSRK